jgi:RecA/RadA recombinase
MSLLQRLKKKSKLESEVLSKSKFFKMTEIPTAIPMLNLALSGKLDGGMSQGITMLAGDSRTYKTGFLIELALAFQKKYPKGIVLFYDSEGSPLKYWEKAGIDMSRVLHCPIKTVEMLRNDLVSQLEELTEEDKVMVVVDSIGTLASAKETADAINDNAAADFTRAKAMNSMFRIVTPYLNQLGIPMVMIGAHYMTMELYPKRVYSGGKKLFLACDEVFFISRSQDKEGKELKGWQFTLTADKSRTVIEGAKFPIGIRYETGVDKYSGMFDIAVECGLIVQSGAWYQAIDLETGELDAKKSRRADIETVEYMERLLIEPKFIEFVSNKYTL